MNRYLILLCICSLLFIISIVAAEENNTPTETPTVVEQIMKGGDTLQQDQQHQMDNPEKEPDEKSKEKSVKYNKKTTLISSIITTLSDLLGLHQEVVTQTRNDVEVEVDGIIVAIVPEESAFNGLTIHEACLGYQYGTTNWFECEMRLQ